VKKQLFLTLACFAVPLIRAADDPTFEVPLHKVMFKVGQVYGGMNGVPVDPPIHITRTGRGDYTLQQSGQTFDCVVSDELKDCSVADLTRLLEKGPSTVLVFQRKTDERYCLMLCKDEDDLPLFTSGPPPGPDALLSSSGSSISLDSNGNQKLGLNCENCICLLIIMLPFIYFFPPGENGYNLD